MENIYITADQGNREIPAITYNINSDNQWRSLTEHMKRKFLTTVGDIRRTTLTLTSDMLSMTDKEIMEKIKFVYAPTYAQGIKRGESRLRAIQQLLRKHRLYRNGNTILDIGSNNGFIPLAFRKHGWAKKVILSDFMKPTVEITNSTWVHPEKIDSINSNSVDVVTIIMTLHHTDNPGDMFKTAQRVLRRNGLLIIREHSISDDQQYMWLDLLDRFWHISAESDEYYSNDGIMDFSYFRSFDNIRTQAESHGFTLVDNTPVTEYNFNYLAVYKKNDFPKQKQNLFGDFRKDCRGTPV